MKATTNVHAQLKNENDSILSTSARSVKDWSVSARSVKALSVSARSVNTLSAFARSVNALSASRVV